MRINIHRVLLVIVALLLGSVVVANAADAGKNLMLNGDFSQGLDENLLPLHWSAFAPLTDEVSVSLSKKYTTVGEFSLELNDANPNRSVGMRSHRVSAKPGQLFLVEVDIYSEFGDAMVYLDFQNDKGQRVVEKTAIIRGPADWQTVSVEGVAPEGTASVSIILYSGLVNVGKLYFDNVRLYNLSQ